MQEKTKIQGETKIDLAIVKKKFKSQCKKNTKKFIMYYF